MSVSTFSHIQELTQGYSVETTPGAAAKISSYRDILPSKTEVYVTLLPGTHLYDTLNLCQRLSSEGLTPVPHFAARQIQNEEVLETGLKRFTEENDSRQILAIAGGSAKPVGEFSNSMQLLQTGLFDKYGIQKIGIAGHPEGSPDIPDKDIKLALDWKNEFAQHTSAEIYIITQFCFESKTVLGWQKKIDDDGIELPVHIGAPGVATLGTLLRHAMQCGVGPSIKVLRRQAQNTSKLLQNSTPEKLLIELAQFRRDNPDCPIQKLHVYPFGGLKKSSDWFQAVADGRFSLSEDNTSISVN